MTEKRLEAKRNHHHVWANHLKRWSPNGKEVYYSTAKGNIAFDSVRAIAATKDFYQIKSLQPHHIEIINEISSHSPEHLQELHTSYLNDFLYLQKLEDIYKKSPIQNQQLDNEFHAQKCNLLENLHASHEKESQEIISLMANRKIEILNNEENMLTLMQFIGHQMSRTKTFKDTILMAQSKTDNKTKAWVGTGMSECWWFISYMFGMNIGASLYFSRKEDKHCILFNDTNTPFITSDQPIINVHESLRNDIMVPPSDEHCDFYYPITPWVAYMINKSDRFQRGINQVSTDVVNELNIKLALRANVYIVSNSEDSLKPLLKYVGQHLKKIQST